MTEHQPAAKGDAFLDEDGNTVRVLRRSRTGTWVDVVAVSPDAERVWSERLPLGIPAAWLRLPRR